MLLLSALYLFPTLPTLIELPVICVFPFPEMKELHHFLLSVSMPWYRVLGIMQRWASEILVYWVLQMDV